MLVLDEQLLGRNLDVALRRWYRGSVVFITDLRPGTVIKDDAIPILLGRQRQATFLTINEQDFWRKVAIDERFCVICFALPNSRAREIPELLRAVFRLAAFRTKALRRGKEMQYPPRVSRRQPDWTGELDDELCAVLNEVYGALHAGLNGLAAMGTRAVIDMVVVREVGDIEGFESNLKALVDAGLLSSAGKETLSAALDAGSASAHRGYVRDDLSIMIDIVENILQALYILKPAAHRLKSATPQRPPRAGPSGMNRIVPFRQIPNQPGPTTRS
jgi:hypothetical protein